MTRGINMSSQKCCFRACDLDASTLRICQTETTCCDKEPKLCFHHACVAEFNSTNNLNEQNELCPFCSVVDEEVAVECTPWILNGSCFCTRGTI